ncbi:undecaprenyl-phosphate galactose phosphotransferase WbaP [Rosenbergiella epipactidis]|uniref:undecaprenyl-phosphate galactose phosphotransferase WbaP n=1 Tax=Rosenbergiella epipactidis TaxID=1544694 RepID=UPI0020268FFE|nr:undecaprenyl-phosphate galactose phosphotransferase WbaP [Rosenbergiella epipactidis]MCL9667439.1 undecaprenyl-phosphate galactose phosphotransferase WbaP [Rosenbergiella epipactidis]
MTRLSRNLLVSSFLILSDFCSLVISLYLAQWIFSNNFSNLNDVNNWKALHFLISVCCIGWYGTRLRHYFYRKTFWFELKEILRTIVIFAIFEIAIIAFTQWYLPRATWIATWVLIMILVPLLRTITKKGLSKVGLWHRDTVIIGSGHNAVEAFNAIESEKNLGFKTIRFIGKRYGNENNQFIENIPVSNESASNLTKNIDKRMQFIIAVENTESELRNTWLRQLMLNGYRYVSVIPTLRGMPVDSTDMSFIFSHEVMIFRVHQSLAKWPSRILKRSFDIVASLLILLVLSPLFLIIMKKVKKDGGPGIYGHERIGKNGKPFKCLKFRSMAVNSKELLADLLANDSQAKAEWDETYKLKNDPRITKVGHLLRRTSMDELPQLFNVLKGEMSLVGPRPIIHAELERYKDQVDYYLMSKPGMTGLWQVSGRSDVDYETRVYFDAWYVKNWSMWNDLVILLKTIAVVMNRNGAY